VAINRHGRQTNAGGDVANGKICLAALLESGAGGVKNIVSRAHVYGVYIGDRADASCRWDLNKGSDNSARFEPNIAENVLTEPYDCVVAAAGLSEMQPDAHGIANDASQELVLGIGQALIA
jgi:hypothetical protein